MMTGGVAVTVSAPQFHRSLLRCYPLSLNTIFTAFVFSHERRLDTTSTEIQRRSFSNQGASSIEIAQLIRDRLNHLRDPFFGLKLGATCNIKVLDLCQQTKSVQIALELPTEAYPKKDQVKSDCASTANEVLLSATPAQDSSKPWDITVNFEARVPKNTSKQAEVTGIANVANIVAVSSCKGGVGKSTVALGLALALAGLGGRTGLLDADVHGPSLPTLLQGADARVFPSQTRPRWVRPVRRGTGGLAALSFGWVAAGAGAGAGGKGAAVMRGAMVSKVINQLLLATEWGDLDYLVIDMPPGTGDIQITLSQLVSLSGAVIVTTPHKLSTIDVEKGIEMFDKLKVPTLCLVENMAYFKCSHGEVHHPFGKSDFNELLQQTSRNNYCNGEKVRLFSLPLSSSVNMANETGLPLAMSNEKQSCEITKLYSKMAEEVVLRIELNKNAMSNNPLVSFDQGRNAILLRYIGQNEAKEIAIPCTEVHNRNPASGELLTKGTTSPDVYPTRMDIKGNYAVGIDWSDGKTGLLYSYQALERIAAELGHLSSERVDHHHQQEEKPR